MTKFAEAQDLPDDSAAAIIAEVLHEEPETGRFHMQLARLYMEAESVPELVAPNAGDSAYRNFFKNYSQILTVMEGLQDPSHKDYSAMLNGLDHKGWAALAYAEDVLSHHTIEVPITDELARSYLDQLRALIDEIVKDDELSSHDRSRIVGLLRKVEEALLDIKIIGTLPVQDAAAAAAAMAHAPGIRERIMGKSWVEAFLTTLRGIVIVLQGADSGMAIAQDVQKMITG